MSTYPPANLGTQVFRLARLSVYLPVADDGTMLLTDPCCKPEPLAKVTKPHQSSVIRLFLFLCSAYDVPGPWSPTYMVVSRQPALQL